RLLAAFEERLPKPWIMIGHSMGATLNLLTLQGGETRFAGALLCGPMLRIRTGKRSLWSVKLATRWNLRHGKAGDYVLDNPDDPFEHTFEHDALTSDESRYELWRQQLYACPHLAVGGPTWGWLAFALDAGERALKPKALKSVKIPVSIVQAEDDDRVWKQTNRWAAKRLGRGRYIEVPGARHEVIMEADGRRAYFLREAGGMADCLAPHRRDPAGARADRNRRDGRRLTQTAARRRATSASSRARGSPQARIWPPSSGASPRQLVTAPPAASITGTRADQSQGCRAASATRSMRPSASMA